MSTVTRSFADSAVKLFGTVSVSADVLSTGVGAIGASFDVLEAKASEWRRQTRKSIAALQVNEEARIASEAAQAIVKHQVEVQGFLGTPSFTPAQKLEAYQAALTAVTAAMAAV